MYSPVLSEYHISHEFVTNRGLACPLVLIVTLFPTLGSQKIRTISTIQCWQTGRDFHLNKNQGAHLELWEREVQTNTYLENITLQYQDV